MRTSFALIIILILISLVFISSCKKINEENETKSKLVGECIQACNEAISNGQNLSDGPCLLDPMSNNHWVCDISHKPRLNIDNKKENQCNAWNNHTADHFIELTPKCELIKVY